MPQWYYQFAKIVGCISLVWLAYIDFEENKLLTAAVSGIAAVILNPFFEIAFLNETWNLVYLFLAIWLVLWSIIEHWLQLQEED
jgi:hypothetical protein